MTRKRPLFATLVVMCIAIPATAQITEEQALERFYTEEIQADWFAPSFLEQVPVAQITPIRERLTGSLGAFQGLERDGDRWMALYEKGRVPTLVRLDDEGRFVGLRLLPPVPNAANLEEVAARFDELSGEGHLLVTVDGDVRFEQNADTPYAVGSAFKLVVLRALVEEIASGARAWSDAVSFDASDRGLGTGTLGEWPDGAPLTLHTLATLMIAQSDNPATDTLLRELGRERVESADPSGRNRPFPTTMEAFKLKDPDNATELQRWRTGDEDARRDLLMELALLDGPGPEIFERGEPVATDVEWFFTARELCDLIAPLGDLDLMGVNPGVVDGDDYARVAYKGGSEPGVINMTTWVRTDDGREICVCATRNADEPIATTGLAGVVTAAFEVLTD